MAGSASAGLANGARPDQYGEIDVLSTVSRDTSASGTSAHTVMVSSWAMAQDSGACWVAFSV